MQHHEQIVSEQDSRIPSREVRDAGSLILCLVVIPVTWMAWLGWRPGFSMMSQDALHLFLPMFRQLFNVQGELADFLYRPGFLGGAKLFGVIGEAPIITLFARLGLSPVTALNTALILFQTVLGFLSIRCCSDLTRLLGNHTSPEEARSSKLPFSIQIGLIWITAFAPVIGWRVEAGHVDLLSGMLLFVSLLSLLLAAVQNRVSVILLGVVTLGLVHCHSMNGHQMKLYGVVFGSWIFATIIGLSRIKNHGTSAWFKRRFIVSAAVCSLTMIAAFFISLPSFFAMLTHALSGDSPRQLGTSVVYSFPSARFEDWIHSLSWLKPDLNGLQGRVVHEVNYPMGPLLILLLLAPLKRGWLVTAGFLVSLGTAICFSLQLEPFATALRDSIPLLNAFRVPERSVLPALMFLPILASASMATRLKSGKKRGRFHLGHWLAAVAGGSASAALHWTVPGLWCEVLLWVLTAGFVVYILVRGHCLVWVGTLALWIIGGASVAAFGSRVSPLFDGSEMKSQINTVSRMIHRLAPQADDPLTRSSLLFNLGPFNINSSLMLSVSSLMGYGNSLQRFSKLYQLIHGYEYDPTTMVFQDHGYPHADVIRTLYNVRYRIGYDGRSFRLENAAPTLGGAWFSHGITWLASMKDLGGMLVQNKDSLAQLLRTTQLLDAEDPAVPSPDAGHTGACLNAKVLGYTSSKGGQTVSVDLASPDTCPLTISMNYISEQDAFATDKDGNRTEIMVYPAYGSLVGLMIPQNTISAEVSVSQAIPSWTAILKVCGVLLWLGALALHIGFTWKKAAQDTARTTAP